MLPVTVIGTRYRKLKRKTGDRQPCYNVRMRFPERLRSFLRARRERREAERLLAALFARPDLGAISSLRPEHRARAVLLGCEAEGGRVARIRFGLVRHPKPLRLPGVCHEVIEIYVYDVAAGSVTVTGSRNLTRRGRPGAAPPPPGA